MKKIIKDIKENYKLVLIVLTIGLVLGGLFFRGNSETKVSVNETESDEGHNHESEDPSTWTCSMHPQIKQEKPGDCPICGMDLIPLSAMQSDDESMDPNELMLSESAAKLADIQTSTVKMQVPENKIFLHGKVQEDERRIASVTARFGGRIENLFVNFTGQQVRKGEKLATLYSPELLMAQRELIEAASFKESRPSMYDAAKSKLKLWDLSDEQIAEIEKKNEPQVYFDVVSPISGTVTMRHITLGDYVEEGTLLFKLVDLNKVWILFDAYENDLSWIKKGDPLEFTIPSLPGETFSGKVAFIDPVIDAKTRIAKVRVEQNNRQQKMKPEMFVSGTVISQVANTQKLVVPKSAVLWTGKRAVVYLKVPDRENPTFLYREIMLGPEAGKFYVVEEGLDEGEEIATNGVFKIDAAAQLQGLTSMMNPEGGAASSGHDHGGMEMGSIDQNAEHNMFTVAGNCSMCKDRIEEAAKSVGGVITASWDAESQMLHLNITKGSDVNKIHHAIAQAGHDTELEKAPDNVYNDLPGCCLYERLEYADKEEITEQSAGFIVAGNCGMCKDRIEAAALSVDGVSSAEWSAETQKIQLKYNNTKTNVDEIQKKIADVGHDTEKFKAPDEVYKELHECCLYERINY